MATAFNVSDPNQCGGDFYSPTLVSGAHCLAADVSLCQYTDGKTSYCVSASSSSTWTESSGSTMSTFAIPGLWFGPTVLQDDTNRLLLKDLFFRDATKKTCSPWPLKYPLDKNGNIILLPLVTRLFDFVDSYMLANSLKTYFNESTIGVDYRDLRTIQTVNDISAATHVDLGNSALATYWSTNLVYCCAAICDSWATALGNAFSYADKAEMIFCLIAISFYLLIFRAEARDLRMGLNEVFSRAFTGDQVRIKNHVR